MSAVEASSTHARLVVSALGLTQIMAWGTSYYLLAVLAAPIAADTGWPLPWVVGGLSCALIAAGIASPWVGRTIQRHGGGPVLAASSLLLAIGLAGVGLAVSLPAYLASWAVIGVGMGAGLYDAAFATVGRLYGRSARSAIITLTLFGGLASTVCWPLSAWLLDQVGWRQTCLIYAGVQLIFAVPLHLAVVPKPLPTAPVQTHEAKSPPLTGHRERRALWLMGFVVALVASGTTMMSVHLLSVLQERGLDLATAVAFGALVGPSQVASRVGEMVFGRHYHPIWTMLASVALIGLGVLLLLTGPSLIALGLMVYGAGNGIHSIAGGALPLMLFDSRRYAAIMGQLAFPKQIAEAGAPAAGAVLLVVGGSSAFLTTLAALYGVALLSCLMLLRVHWSTQ